MTLEQKIKMAIGYKGINQSKLADDIGMSRQKFNQRLKRGAFTDAEINAVASALGAVYESAFEFPDGIKIG
jgi:hypothetical protein